MDTYKKWELISDDELENQYLNNVTQNSQTSN